MTSSTNRHIGAGTNIFMHLRKYNQQEEFWKASLDTFSYLHAEYFINPDVKSWREREIDRANKRLESQAHKFQIQQVIPKEQMIMDLIICTKEKI